MILSRLLTAALLFSCAAEAGAATTAAKADKPVSLGSFVDWTAYTYKLPDTRVCYIISSPKSSDSSKKVKRDPIFFLVTNMPGRKIKGEVSTIIGYPFKEKSTVTVKVDDESFELFTNNDGAWADSADKEKKIVAALKKGKTLSVKGTSWKGTETTDHYSLTGFSTALEKIDGGCK